MSKLSRPEHSGRYSPSISLPKKAEDIKQVLRALLILDIASPLKKSILRQVLWEFTYAAGNAQGSRFLGRWRSETVIRQAGRKIQRDHVYGINSLLNELLGPLPDFDRIAARAQCCVVVTDYEHKRLTDVNSDGGEKCRIAGITVYDMLDQTPMAPELVWGP